MSRRIITRQDAGITQERSHSRTMAEAAEPYPELVSDEDVLDALDALDDEGMDGLAGLQGAGAGSGAGAFEAGLSPAAGAAPEAEPPMSADAAAAAGLEPDDYTSRLLKYIPAEVIALYVTLEGIVRATGADRADLLWIIFLVGLVATPLYLWKVGGVTAFLHLAISTLAFAVWIFALGGPFEGLGVDPIYGALLLPTFTFFIALVEPRPLRART